MCKTDEIAHFHACINSLLVLHKEFEPIVTCRLQNPSLGTICRSKSGLMKWFLYRSSTCLIFLVHILYQVKIRYNDHWSVSQVNSSNRPIGLFISGTHFSSAFTYFSNFFYCRSMKWVIFDKDNFFRWLNLRRYFLILRPIFKTMLQFYLMGIKSSCKEIQIILF